MLAPLSDTIHIICTLKKSGFKVRKRGKKVGSKCVVLCPFAGNTLLLSVKKVCSVNGRSVVHQGQNTF
jgi:hypothetical protein